MVTCCGSDRQSVGSVRIAHFHNVSSLRQCGTFMWSPYIDIILNVKFSSEKIRDKDWPKIKKKIQYLLSVGEYKTPIHFNELEMYIKGLVNVNTISAK